MNYCGREWCQEEIILRWAFAVPPLLVVQSSGKLVVSNRRAGSNMKVSIGQAFSGLLSHCCACEIEKRNNENFVLGYLCATQCGCLEGQCCNTTHPLMDRQFSWLLLCFTPSLAEQSFCSCWELVHLIVIQYSYSNFMSLGHFEVLILKCRVQCTKMIGK